MSKILFSALIEGISTRQDNTFKIILGANEMDKSQVADLFDLRNQFTKVFISSNNISEMEERLIDEQHLQDGKKVKTKSQRLRASLYRLHESEGGTKETFDDFYSERMERLIEQVKQKIEA